jgi:cyanophycinase
VRRWLLALVSLVFLSGACLAQENPLGLPTPRDPRRPGAVLLHGGGPITGEVFNRFVDLAGGASARIVLVPSAGYCPRDYGSEQEFYNVISRRYSSWAGLVGRGYAASFTFLYTDDPDDANDPEFVRPLESATGVWFSGGYQSRLNYRYVGDFPRQTRFQAALRGVLERGGVVGGTSAGMAALPEVITMWDERRRLNGPATAVAAHGLGVFSQAIVEQHFDGRGGRLERFTGLLRDSARLDQLTGRAGAGERMIGIAVNESTALVAQGSRLEVHGAGSAHLFMKSPVDRSIVWHELASGESARFRREANGLAALQRDALVASSK